MKTYLNFPLFVFSSFVLLLLPACSRPVSADETEEATAEVVSPIESIRQAAAQKTIEPEGFPLPLASTWGTGIYHYGGPGRARGVDPAWQLEQIEEGRRYLPVFAMPEMGFDDEQYADYLYPPFERVADLELPFCLLGSQWERHLTSAEEYFSLPPGENPNVVTPEGVILKKLDPFGPTEPWFELGKRLTDHPVMDRLQEIYPDPPRIIFVSNNEHTKLRWTEVAKSKRYLEKYGEDQPNDFKRKVVGDAWIKKYRALQKGMREGLKSKAWQEKSVFIGYGGDVGMEAMGRWAGWTKYSLHSQGRASIAPYQWDGVSPSYYMHNWSAVSDYQVMGNQIEAMNAIPALKEAYKINPEFWFEISVWDGDEPNKTTGSKPKLTVYREARQTYDMDRYQGWLQYGIWLLRPRVVRLYRGGWTAPIEYIAKTLPHVEQAVSRVHEHASLKHYWRKGELVPNPHGQHPYQQNLPNEIAIQERWFLLDTDVNPERPWKLETNISVFALALKLGEAPNRSWLVYAHAPLRDYRDVEITIPGWAPIQVDVPREGAFYEIKEVDGSVIGIKDA